MRFATYNIWYEGIDIRAAQLFMEIDKTDADVIGLQEVPPDFYEQLTRECKYKHSAYAAIDDEVGLAIVSKHPILAETSLVESGALAQNIFFEKDGMRFSVTNVHLPWDSALEKEKQIVAVNAFIHKQKDAAHFFVLLGDFNSTMASGVHHFLMGDCSLLGHESKPYWNDLAYAHASLNGYTVAPTLDFVNNPRWRGENTVYVPDVVDRIYVMESFNWDYTFDLHDVRVFGKEVSSKTGFAPSDHYGVLADADFRI